jgi:hypothetical protein
MQWYLGGSLLLVQPLIYDEHRDDANNVKAYVKWLEGSTSTTPLELLPITYIPNVVTCVVVVIVIMRRET